MKNYVTLMMVALLSLGCNSQENKNKEEITADTEKKITEAPEGSWKVNKEFDEEGNLIRYDSIYSWSSGTDLDNLASMDKDSTLRSMQSRFYKHFSDFDFDREGFGDLFAEDSLFTKHFFNHDFFSSDFGRDFMDIDKMHERMGAMQKKFLERYQDQFKEHADTLSEK